VGRKMGGRKMGGRKMLITHVPQNCQQLGGRATVGLSPCPRYFSASHFSAHVWNLPGSLARSGSTAELSATRRPSDRWVESLPALFFCQPFFCPELVEIEGGKVENRTKNQQPATSNYNGHGSSAQP
jgi:hypothetical protein